MVCRENKGRSAAISLLKHMLRGMGVTSYRDWEAQSLTHEMGHRFAEAPDPTKEELVAMWKGMRQQVLNDPTISDGDKFRPATGRGGQPGIITRIDQELERLRTGCDEHGRTLRPEQLNLGKHFAAVARMGGTLMRQQAAKRSYFEVYARHMGVTMDEAQTRFEELTSRERDLRDKTQIDLTDTWRKDLAVAGFSAQGQSDIGQSNQTRFALMTMEAERRAKIASLPSRPTIRPEHRHPVLSPDDPAVKQQCIGGCGQFGHEWSNCPNKAYVTAAANATSRYQQARATFDAMHRVGQARSDLKALEAGEPVSNVDSGGVRTWPDIDADTIHPDNQAAIAALTETAQGEYSVRKMKAAVTEVKEARQDLADAEEALTAARGVIPQVSSFVSEIAYNPEASVFTVTTRPKTLKQRGKDGTPAGTVRPGKTYVYHMTEDEYQRLLASPDFGHQISTGVFVRGPEGDRFKFENDADVEAAKTQRRCPSCGQWATMNSAHRCPVDGSGTDEENFRHREELRLAVEKARLAGLGASVASAAPRAVVRDTVKVLLPAKNWQRVQVRDADGTLREVVRPVQGSIVVPNPKAVAELRNGGQVALGPFTARYLDAEVRGDVAVWNEPGTRNPLYRVSNVKCSCGVRQPCRHATAATVFAGRPYGAVETAGTPGTQNFEKPRYTAEDQIDTIPRVGFSRIVARREQAAVAYARDFVSTPARRGFASTPRTGDGIPVSPDAVPRLWRSDTGAVVDMDKPDQVATVVHAELSARTEGGAAAWRVTPDPRGGVWVRSVAASTKRDSELQDAFSLPSVAGRRGVYIAPERAARHEMLDRLMGRKPQWKASPVIAHPSDPDPMA